MRLLVAERPQRRDLGVPGQVCVLRHDRPGFVCADEEDVERKWRACIGLEASVDRPHEIECSARVTDEHCPAARPDEPGHWNTSSVRAQLEPALPAAHEIDRTATIELRSAFAKTEYGSITQTEEDSSGLLIDA